MTPLRTAATTSAFRRMTQRLVLGGGRSSIEAAVKGTLSMAGRIRFFVWGAGITAHGHRLSDGPLNKPLNHRVFSRFACAPNLPIGLDTCVPDRACARAHEGACHFDEIA